MKHQLTRMQFHNQDAWLHHILRLPNTPKMDRCQMYDKWGCWYTVEKAITGSFPVQNQITSACRHQNIGLN